MWLIDFKRRLNAGPFFLSGIFLLVCKCVLDYWIASMFDQEWSPAQYFIQAMRLDEVLEGSKPVSYLLTLLVTAIPFVYVGTILCVWRLRSASVPAWLVIFFFVPMLNYVLFVLLSFLPERKEASLDAPVFTEESAGRGSVHNRWGWLPRSRLAVIIFTVGTVSAICMVLLVLSVYVLGEYGWGLFIGVPFLLGFGSVFVYGLQGPMTGKSAFWISTLTMLLFCAFMLALALEGVICILMMAPLGILLSGMGATLAWHLTQSTSRRGQLNSFLSLLVALPAWMWGESLVVPAGSELFEVRSEVIVNASRQEVWDHLITFDLAPPQEWIFRTGIAYPINARIEGYGEGAIRYCNFTTGSFVEPIEVWNEPVKLAFTVAAQPEPMKELSPYGHLDVPHLHGTFRSERGQFELEDLGNGQTRLIGTTW